MSVAKMIVRRGYDRSEAASHVDTTNIRELIYQLTPKEIMPHWLYRPYAWLKRRARKRLRIGHLTLINFCEQAPNRASRVTLGAERDVLGVNKLVVDWRVGEAERRTVVQLHEAIGRAVERAGIGAMEVGADDPDDMHFTDASHHMGTTRMGDDPKAAVVDHNCRMHGVRNLYIAGSSVFPTSGHANPTLTIIALTLRLAEHLKAEASRTL